MAPVEDERLLGLVYVRTNLGLSLVESQGSRSWNEEAMSRRARERGGGELSFITTQNRA